MFTKIFTTTTGGTGGINKRWKLTNFMRKIIRKNKINNIISLITLRKDTSVFSCLFLAALYSRLIYDKDLIGRDIFILKLICLVSSRNGGTCSGIPRNMYVHVFSKVKLWHCPLKHQGRLCIIIFNVLNTSCCFWRTLAKRQDALCFTVSILG